MSSIPAIGDVHPRRINLSDEFQQEALSLKPRGQKQVRRQAIPSAPHFFARADDPRGTAASVAFEAEPGPIERATHARKHGDAEARKHVHAALVTAAERQKEVFWKQALLQRTACRPAYPLALHRWRPQALQ